MAAQIRRELQVDVDMIHGGYGEFLVLVDRATVIDGGAFAALGVLPSRRKVVDAVRTRLEKGCGIAEHRETD